MINNNLIFVVGALLLITSCKKDKVSSKVSGSSNTIPIYNQAYQENFDEDKITYLVDEAKNGYVLVDPFQENITEYIADLKANGNEVGGYISIGTGEDWRDDFEEMKPFLVEKQWGQWAGEYFVNETQTGIIPIMKKRIDKMADWGCTWVEFDNMDWAFDDNYRKEYKFNTSADDGISFYNELCDYVHEKGMKCMAKNVALDGEGFDGILYESYDKEKNWWDKEEAKLFLDAGKLVIVNHYNEKNCDKVYKKYKKDYNDDICFICESKSLKKYVHYNEE